METSQNVRTRIAIGKFSRFLLKYIPYVLAVGYTMFCLWRGLGNDKKYIVTSFGSSGFLWMVYIYLSSLSQGFCKWHRRLLIYDFSVWFMIYCEMWFGLGKFRRPLNWIFFAIGLLLVVRVSIFIYNKNYGKGRNAEDA